MDDRTPKDSGGANHHYKTCKEIMSNRGGILDASRKFHGNFSAALGFLSGVIAFLSGLIVTMT
jgi:hypothetical protein